MNNHDDTFVSEGEAAILLGMSTSGVAYVCESGRLKAHPINGLRHYKLSDVETLRALRTAKPERRGRPSAAKLLQRRFHCGPRDVVQPNAGGNLPLSGGLPPERHVIRRDDGSTEMRLCVDPCLYRRPQSGGMPVTFWAQNPPEVARRLLAKDGIQYIRLVGSRDGLHFSPGLPR
jgi:hypothetical protein